MLNFVITKNYCPMKKIIVFSLAVLFSCSAFAGIVEKTYHPGNYSLRTNGNFQTITFDQAKLSGIPGEPSLPYLQVALMLPPGESAESIEIIRENEVMIPGAFQLFPKQDVLPLSKRPTGEFLKKESVYSMNKAYPASPAGKLLPQFLNGYGFALSTFTPVSYIPATGQLSYFKDITVRIHTKSDRNAVESLKNISSSKSVLDRVKMLAQNPEMINGYPQAKSPKTNYQYLIITPALYQTGYQDLINYYQSIGIICQVATTESIASGMTGVDLQEKIRKYIIQEYQNSGIEYVLIGGTETVVPSRRTYVVVYYGTGGIEEESSDIPADIYYSALDGTWDANLNGIFGEEADNPDLLPDVAVGRFPFTNATELAAMVHKSVSYQSTPVEGEFTKPLLAGEYLYDTPVTLGGDYMKLLVNDHGDNGYFTKGIPSAANSIITLYDTLTGSSSSTYWAWNVSSLVQTINNGTSFIHHLGHANYDYALRMSTWDITNANFSQVDGIHHNYALIYTQGCNCGGFDNASCIASQMLAIDNFAAAGVFNTRFGWFDQGTTDGPSEHLQREFVSALYDNTAPEHHFGTAHMISKIKTAPWIGLPGEFEPGAQRWTHYDCTLLGDPALFIRTENSGTSGVTPKTAEYGVKLYPNPSRGAFYAEISLTRPGDVVLHIETTTGQSAGITRTWKNLESGNQQLVIDPGTLSPGIYFCRFNNGQSELVRKLIISQ